MTRNTCSFLGMRQLNLTELFMWTCVLSRKNIVWLWCWRPECKTNVIESILAFMDVSEIYALWNIRKIYINCIVPKDLPRIEKCSPHAWNPDKWIHMLMNLIHPREEVSPWSRKAGRNFVTDCPKAFLRSQVHFKLYHLHLTWIVGKANMSQSYLVSDFWLAI